ncbi:GIY-YIG nuclease family protein [Kushneria sinocarnis]|uniref:GIY-YIG nuclease family protein n=1 Tax=Kushneria sinocarnis TaxID=595502 RepID=UPI0024821B32|nr:GIY-YIG nuclease family protein [Kushneria sinocarnis]
MASADNAGACWWLYMLETAQGRLYTGITTDVERRLAEHRAGGRRGARALRGKGPLVLRYACRVGTHSEALRLEAAIKRWPASKKRALCGAAATERHEADIRAVLAAAMP